MQRMTIYLLITGFVSCSAFAQSLDSLILVTEKLYQNTQRHITFPLENWPYTFTPSKTKDSSNIFYEIQLKEAQNKVLRNDIGLAINANAQYNFNSDLDLETNRFTKSRIKAELEWNILKGGFISNRNKARELENDVAILTTQKQREQRALWRRHFKLQYSYRINEELIALFTQKQYFLNNYFDVIATLYANKRIKRETFIELSHLISITQTELKNTKELNVQLQESLTTDIPFKKLPFLEIEELSFLEAEYKQEHSDSLRAKNVQLQHHWTNNTSLSIYANYNWLQTDINHRNFGSVGLRLRVPIPFLSKREIIKAIVAKDLASHNNKLLGFKNQFTTYANSYREKIKDIKNQYKNWQLLEEQKRVLKLLKQELITDETGIRQLSLQLTQFDILENTLRLKMQLYAALSHLYELNNKLTITPLIFEKSAQKEVIVVKNDAYDTPFKIAFAKAKNINTIYIDPMEVIDTKLWRDNGFIVKTTTTPEQYISLSQVIKTAYNNLKN